MPIHLGAAFGSVEVGDIVDGVGTSAWSECGLLCFCTGRTIYVARCDGSGEGQRGAPMRILSRIDVGDLPGAAPQVPWEASSVPPGSASSVVRLLSAADGDAVRSVAWSPPRACATPQEGTAPSLPEAVVAGSCSLAVSLHSGNTYLIDPLSVAGAAPSPSRSATVRHLIAGPGADLSARGGVKAQVRALEESRALALGFYPEALPCLDGAGALLMACTKQEGRVRLVGVSRTADACDAASDAVAYRAWPQGHVRAFEGGEFPTALAFCDGFEGFAVGGSAGSVSLHGLKVAPRTAPSAEDGLWRVEAPRLARVSAPDGLYVSRLSASPAAGPENLNALCAAKGTMLELSLFAAGPGGRVRCGEAAALSAPHEVCAVAFAPVHGGTGLLWSAFDGTLRVEALSVERVEKGKRAKGAARGDERKDLPFRAALEDGAALELLPAQEHVGELLRSSARARWLCPAVSLAVSPSRSMVALLHTVPRSPSVSRVVQNTLFRMKTHAAVTAFSPLLQTLRGAPDPAAALLEALGPAARGAGGRPADRDLRDLRLLRAENDALGIVDADAILAAAGGDAAERRVVSALVGPRPQDLPECRRAALEERVARAAEGLERLAGAAGSLGGLTGLERAAAGSALRWMAAFHRDEGRRALAARLEARLAAGPGARKRQRAGVESGRAEDTGAPACPITGAELAFPENGALLATRRGSDPRLPALEASMPLQRCCRSLLPVLSPVTALRCIACGAAQRADVTEALLRGLGAADGEGAPFAWLGAAAPLRCPFCGVDLEAYGFP